MLGLLRQKGIEDFVGLNASIIGTGDSFVLFTRLPEVSIKSSHIVMRVLKSLES